jgi:archaellin
MKKILALLFMLFAATAYAIPPMPSGTPPVGTITGLFTGEGDYLKSDGTKGTPSGSGDVVGPAASTQYKIPLWGAADKTLVDGVAVGTEGMLLRSAGAGAYPAWSAYTLALPGAAGAVLYSDGTNWTRSTAPSLLALTLYGQSAGGGAQIALGSNSGSSDPNDGKILFRNATNTNAFTVQTGVSGAALSWTLPTAAPGGNNYLLNVDADGTMGYTDPSTLGGGATTITVSAHTATGDIANTETVIGTRVTNTGATGTITLTLPQCSTTHYPVAVYLTEAKAVVLTPYSGDQFMVLTSAADKTLTSGATAGSFIAFECLASGKWYPTGLNGAWTSN